MRKGVQHRIRRDSIRYHYTGLGILEYPPLSVEEIENGQIETYRHVGERPREDC